MNSKMPPHDVQVDLNYIGVIDPNGPLYTYTEKPSEGTPIRSWHYEPHSVLVHDVRGTELECGASLDVHGFQYLKATFRDHTFVDEEDIRTIFYKEVESLLLKVIPGAKRIYILNHNVRGIESNRSSTATGPSLLAHCDKTIETSRNLLTQRLGPEAERLSRSRVRMVNFWRPILQPVACNPLAVMDWRSLVFKDASLGGDLNTVRRIRAAYENTAYNISYNPNHQWFYMSDQTPEDILLFKTYDSHDVGGTAIAAPHASWEEPAKSHLPPRTSFDLRAFVFDTE